MAAIFIIISVALIVVLLQYIFAMKSKARSRKQSERLDDIQASLSAFDTSLSQIETRIRNLEDIQLDYDHKSQIDNMKPADLKIEIEQLKTMIKEIKK